MYGLAILSVAVDGIENPVHRNSMNQSSLAFTHFLVTIDMILG
jgi:hypothetical protein